MAVYEQTNYAHITPAVKALYQAKSRRAGHEIIPLAKGEQAPDTPAPDEPEAAQEAEDTRVSLNGDLEPLEELLGENLGYEVFNSQPFERIEDLLDIPGIGPATLERLRDRVTL